MDDVKFLQNLFKKFVPGGGGKSKNPKHPVFKGWLNVTPKQSAELARHADYQDGPFIFLTGKTTEYMTIDLDRKDPSRADHVDKRDGVEYWDENYNDPVHMNTLIIKTPKGGFHLVYKYQEGITSGQLEKDVLIDILADGKGMCFGPGYEIMNRAIPLSPPIKLVQQQINVHQQIYGNVHNLQVANGTNTRVQRAKRGRGDSLDYSSEINAAANCDLVWDVIPSPDNKMFTIIPHTSICTVDDTHVHSEQKHSRFVITKTRVIARCFSHSAERMVTGVTSTRLRELFFNEEFSDSFKEFMHSLLELCNDSSFARLDGSVWKVRDDKPWIYDRIASYEEFINTHFKSHTVFVSNPRKFADVTRYMEIADHDNFPFLKKDLDCIGFDNCVLNIATYEVLDGNSWSKAIVPRHSIGQTFDWDNTETPLFDSLIQYQLGDSEVYRYFLALIGRLFYATKRFDNYSIVPLIKGDTGTGKSTILTIIQKMFAPGAVGVLNCNNEITFGLEGKYTKELLIAHEIGDKFTDRLSSDLFKQMVCGEEISIPRKHKSAIDVTWSVPMFLCSNNHLLYTDNQGSISRRLAIFKFERYVQHKDITLETKIINSELPAIIAKCLLAYRSMLAEIGNRSFWEVCPDYFNDNTREMCEQTDYIYMFLTLPPGDNVYGDKDVYFMKQEGACMLLQDFKNKFVNYMRFRHPGVKYKWTSDYSSFNKLGYSVRYQNICKGCGSHASAGCCKQYNFANRSKRYVINDLVCVGNEHD